MYCQICKQKSATVHFTELEGGKKTEIHICQDCAEEKGFLADAAGFASKLFTEYPEKEKPFGSGFIRVKGCAVCGMKYADFRASGRLGCGACYETFADKLSAVVRKVHGSAVHVGKSPDLTGDALRRRDIKRHRRRLKELVIQERFEEASRLRDMINELER